MNNELLDRIKAHEIPCVWAEEPHTHRGPAYIVERLGWHPDSELSVKELFERRIPFERIYEYAYVPDYRDLDVLKAYEFATCEQAERWELDKPDEAWRAYWIVDSNAIDGVMVDEW
jgi:hypothetical protein